MSGKRQRPSYLEIDEKTLEYKDNPQPKGDEEKAPPISERKIYKIKGIAEAAAEPAATKAKFTLFGSAEKSDNNNGQQSGSAKPNDQKPQDKDINKDKKPSTGLFGSNQSLFGNGTGLFSQANSGNQGLGLFSSSSTSNIFSKNSQPSSDANKPLGGSIFGNSGQSIFNFSSGNVPPLKKGESKGNEDEDEGDSAELEKEQNKQIDPTKSSGKYQYEVTNKLLFQALAPKLKKNNGDIVENVEVVVQEEISKKLNWVVIRLPATKNTILSGLLVKGKSEVKKLGEKDENAIVSIVKLTKQGAPEKLVLKIQFEKAEDGTKFRETVEALLK